MSKNRKRYYCPKCNFWEMYGDTRFVPIMCPVCRQEKLKLKGGK